MIIKIVRWFICRFDISQWTGNQNTTECSTSALYLDVLLKLETNGKITTQLYDKGDDFNFSIVNFLYLCSNIPASLAYGVYISQLIRCARPCSKYDQFLARGSLHTNKLMSKGFQQSHLHAAFRKFYGRYNDVICPYNLSLAHMLSDMFHTNRYSILDILILTTDRSVYLKWK
jgi:hypothetical protein